MATSTENPMYGTSGLEQDEGAVSNEYVSVSVSSNPMYNFVQHDYGQETRHHDDRSQGSTSESEREGITIPGRGPPIRTFKDRPASPNTVTHSLPQYNNVPERSSSESSSDGDPLRGMNGIDSPYSYARHTRNARLRYTNSPNTGRHEPVPIKEEQEDVDSGNETGRDNSSSTISNGIKKISSNIHSHQPNTPRYITTQSHERIIADSSSYRLYKRRPHSCDSHKGDVILVFVSLLTIVMSAVAIGLCVVLLTGDTAGQTNVVIAPATDDNSDTSRLEQTTSSPITCNCSAVPQSQQLPANLMQQLEEVKVEFQALQQQGLSSPDMKELLQMLLDRVRSIDLLIQQLKPQVSQPRTPELKGIDLPLMFETNATSDCQQQMRESSPSFGFDSNFHSFTQTPFVNYIKDGMVMVNPHCEQSNGNKDFTTLQVKTSSADANIIDRLIDTEVICLCYSLIEGGTCRLYFSQCPYQPVALTTALVT